jgi:RimJ/RimL family protein N-acetyltransferase
MQGNYCSLVPLEAERHGSQLLNCFALDSTGWTYLPYGPFREYGEFQEWLKEMESQKDPLFYTILEPQTGEPVGLCAYLRITPEHGVIEVGHLHFSKRLKRTVGATEAMYLMMRRAFEELEYRRYEWKCDALNLPSRLAAQRLGFQFEGLFRQDRVVKERSRDTAWFSIIDKEWPKIKSSLEEWLHPDNFDSDGVQKRSLGSILSSV